MTRTEIINNIIKMYDLKSYLEIGTRNKDHNFNHIVCQEKLCIDPYPETPPVDIVLTSDEFFKVCGKKFDCIFIDGLHEAHQVFKDIVNALNHLNEGGVIICHDCMPMTNEAQKEFESYKGTEIWNGDSWKGFAKYRQNSPFFCYTVTEDEGCGIIDTNQKSDIEDKDRLGLNINELTYSVYEEYKDRFMNFKENIQENTKEDKC